MYWFAFRFPLALIVGLNAGAAPSDVRPPAHSIAAIKAVLYHQETAAIDTVDVTGPDAALWNTAIGEGVAGAPSGATLVFVQVIDAPFLAGTGGTVRLTVHVGSAQVYAQDARLRLFFSEKRFIWVPFLIYDEASCHPWKLVATLLGGAGNVESTLSKEIRFTCGE